MVANKLTIYKIRDEFQDDRDIIKSYDVKKDMGMIGSVYIKRSSTRIPDWVESFFRGHLSSNELFTANARAVLIARIGVPSDDHGELGDQKIFAVTMGYGKSMLEESAIEERFGLKVILNTIGPNCIRKLSKINIGGNQKQSFEQLPLKSGISEFGFDIHRDMISNITGLAEDNDYCKGLLSGGEALSLTAEIDADNITEFLIKTYKQYKLTKYAEDFPWIDQIQDVKDKQLIEQLNENLILAINRSSPDIWTAVPEIINWEEIKGFKYISQHSVLPDISIDKIKESLGGEVRDMEQLKAKRISAISAIDDSERYSWPSSKCLFGELSLDEKEFCINNGKWYSVNKDYASTINNEYQGSKIALVDFNDYNINLPGERAYNESFVNSKTDHFILMDGENILYGGGQSKIELCDILSAEKQLIYVKKYSGSSTLSHLFSQAAVSAELILFDAEFLSLANQCIANKTSNPNFKINDGKGMNIVFAIISEDQGVLPQIPFFSKVSYRYTKQHLEAMGFDLSIKRIKKTADPFEMSHRS